MEPNFEVDWLRNMLAVTNRNNRNLLENVRALEADVKLLKADLTFLGVVRYHWNRLWT